jgi:Ca2+/Na+ antiporter
MGLATLALLRLNTPEFAYLFLRPIHVLVVATAVVLAVFVTRFLGSRWLAMAFLALVAIYLQILVFRVPHVPSMRDADAALADRVAGLDGALVLVENTPHRDMDADPSRTTEPPPFAAHLEQGLAAATGRRLYTGLWDGWQWSPYRTQLLAGGAFRGRALSTVSVDELRRELRKWGVRHLVVWSAAAQSYLRSHPEFFAERWTSGAWRHFEYLVADAREVAVATGHGSLEAFDPLGAVLRLEQVRSGDLVVVRTNYHPSWHASVAGAPGHIDLINEDGQLAFRSPRDGSYEVRLSYPRRLWALVIAIAAVVLGSVSLTRLGRPGPSVSNRPY